MIRKALFAGTWYPLSSGEIKEYMDPTAKTLNAVAAVCPHAGWMYSGKTAGKVYSRLPKADTFILVGPNHSGMGENASVFAKGSWAMPLGDIEIDTEVAKSILRNSEFLQEDYAAHQKEHSIEVQLPFIQYLNPKAKIIPITIMVDNNEICADIGRSIALAVKQATEKKIVVIASTDMSHYEPKRIAKLNDSEAIDKIVALDPAGLLETVARRGISMCGAAPVASILYAAKEIGALEAQLVKYSTSGDVTGDDSSVVGYAGIILY